MSEDIEYLILVSGGGNGKTTACVMSAASLFDDRLFDDSHPSRVTKKIGVYLNDENWWESNDERTFVLLPFVLDGRLRASKYDYSVAAEKRRADMCVHWLLSCAVPAALDCAADALQAKWRDTAAALNEHARKLREDPTRDNAIDAHVKVVAAAEAAYVADAAGSAYAAANTVHAAIGASDYNTIYADSVRCSALTIYAAALAVDTDDYAAAYAAGYNVAYAAQRVKIRGSLVALFDKLLDVRA